MRLEGRRSPADGARASSRWARAPAAFMASVSQRSNWRSGSRRWVLAEFGALVALAQRGEQRFLGSRGSHGGIVAQAILAPMTLGEGLPPMVIVLASGRGEPHWWAPAAVAPGACACWPEAGARAHARRCARAACPGMWRMRVIRRWAIRLRPRCGRHGARAGLADPAGRPAAGAAGRLQGRAQPGCSRIHGRARPSRPAQYRLQRWKRAGALQDSPVPGSGRLLTS